jgi:hypothetical protein
MKHWSFNMLIHQFLIGALVVACLFTHGISFGSSTEDLLENKVKAIELKYRLKVFYKDVPAEMVAGTVGEPAQQKDYPYLLKALNIFDQELSKYPTEFISKLNWKTVVFLKKFFYTEHPIAGLYDPHQEIVYLEFLRQRFNPLPIRHGIHHEIFHIIDVQAQMQFLKSDKDWLALNDSNFIYGKVDDLGKGKERPYRLAPAVKGFPSAYALTSAQEDMAEVFGCMMLASQHKLLLKWQQDDEILNRKLNYIKNLLEQFYPSINEEFWKNLLKNR